MHTPPGMTLCTYADNAHMAVRRGEIWCRRHPFGVVDGLGRAPRNRRTQPVLSSRCLPATGRRQQCGGLATLPSSDRKSQEHSRSVPRSTTQAPRHQLYSPYRPARYRFRLRRVLPAREPAHGEGLPMRSKTSLSMFRPAESPA
jgi:hypothetical protein